MYEDGTNVPIGTAFLEASRVISDLYVPAKSKAPSDWVEWWGRLRTLFEKLRDECRPIECVLVQKHTPDYGGSREAHPILDCFEGSPRRVGGLSRDDTPLLTPTGQQMFGAFAICDADGKPMSNSAGDPFAWRFGLRRDFYLYPAPLSIDESRPLPGPPLMELIRDATGLLVQLPSSAALSLWRNWRSGFSLMFQSGDNLWLDAIFELAWQRHTGHPLHADRFAWHDNVSFKLSGDGLFPRLPEEPIYPGLELVPTQGGFPMAYYSKLPDVVRASVTAIDEIIERGKTDMNQSGKRFAVALSFPGERRSFVEKVAAALAERVGRERVLYDRYHEADLARLNLDTYLQGLYHNESELNAVFLCAEYERKEWCGLEWRAIRDLVKTGRASAVMPLRFDDTEIPGLFSTDGYIWIGNRSPQEISDLILQRMQVSMGASPAKKAVDSEGRSAGRPVVDNSVSDYLAQAQRLNCLPRLVVDKPGGSGHSNGFEFHFLVKNIGSGAAEQINAEIVHGDKVLKTDRLRDIPNGTELLWKPGFGARFPFAGMSRLLLRFRYSNILGKPFVSDFQLDIASTGDFARQATSEYFGPPR